MLHAGISELRKAFFLHSSEKNIKENSASRYLLLFYAVESGLKAIYLKSNHQVKTNQISNQNLKNSHDLLLWVKELKLPASITNGCRPRIKLKRDNSSFDISFAHQAWRYCVEIEEKAQHELVQWLKNVKDWVEEKL